MYWFAAAALINYSNLNNTNYLTVVVRSLKQVLRG